MLNFCTVPVLYDCNKYIYKFITVTACVQWNIQCDEFKSLDIMWQKLLRLLMSTTRRVWVHQAARKCQEDTDMIMMMTNWQWNQVRNSNDIVAWMPNRPPVGRRERRYSELLNNYSNFATRFLVWGEFPSPYGCNVYIPNVWCELTEIKWVITTVSR